MTRRAPVIIVATFLAVTGGCKAGPSAFGRRASTSMTSARADTTRAAPTDTGHAVRTRPTDTGHTSRTPPGDTVRPAMGETTLAPAAGSAPADTPASSDNALTDTTSAASTTSPADSSGVPHFTRPKYVRGLYVNAWAAGSARRMDELAALAERTEINTFVIDIKDASGYVSYDTRVPLAREIGATGQIRIHDLPALLRRLYRDGIYPIARIVVVKDPILTAARPDLAVHDTSGNVFRDDKGTVWVNPYNRTVWKYDVALARDAARMGFPEIQWDYIRFPDIPKAERAAVVYPGADHRTKAQVIAGFMQYSRKQLHPLGVRVTADVFGVTASATRDVGIGQVWVAFIGNVDVAQPMVYPSHWWKGSFGYDTPNAYPYEVVRQALADALRQSAEVPGAGAVRPWLQDFTLGKPPYGAPEVRAEIQATYDSGIKEWFLWNPGSTYTESALKPVSGFETEPMIRVDGHVVPVSRRWEFVDSAGMDRPQPDTLPTPDTTAVPDTMGRTDTLAAPDTTTVPDTLVTPDTAAVPDTLGRPDTLAPADTARLATRCSRSPGASSSARARRRTR